MVNQPFEERSAVCSQEPFQGRPFAVGPSLLLCFVSSSLTTARMYLYVLFKLISSTSYSMWMDGWMDG